MKLKTNKFQQDMEDKNRFVITLELVPGALKNGTVENVMKMVSGAKDDGRISAISMTDNPGGNPALVPDAIGWDVMDMGIDVILHFACRDMNRVALESRAMQLKFMKLKNILVLSGDYTNNGFSGQGTPVFDLDSVLLTCMLNHMNRRDASEENHLEFYTGCAISPFKWTEAECFTQYAKMKRKVQSGAKFLVTQVGYDVRKLHELLMYQEAHNVKLPTMASVFYITQGAARAFHQGKVPGITVTDAFLKQIDSEVKAGKSKREVAIEKTAKLAAIVKGLGYKGLHLGGIHKQFSIVTEILDRFEAYQNNWQSYLSEFYHPKHNTFYYYEKEESSVLNSSVQTEKIESGSTIDKVVFNTLDTIHNSLFSFNSSLAPGLSKLCKYIDKSNFSRRCVELSEDFSKMVLFSCQRCGDCAIQYLGYICPERNCPKHMRVGPCGGSKEEKCEVWIEKPCVWTRAYNRFAAANKTEKMMKSCVLPRLWHLHRTSSWLNFHLKRDHQSIDCKGTMGCFRSMNNEPKPPGGSD